MVNPVGPVFTGGFEEFVVDDEGSGEQHTILYLPDLNNDPLQAEGKPQVYYWAPGTVRLARSGDVGDFKFHHTHFVGVLDEQTHVGVEDHAEVVGGVLAFTTTARYPTSVLQRAHEQLLAKFSGRDDRYWGTRTRVSPEFRIVPITSNTTAVTNLSPGADGTAPAENLSPRPNPGPVAPAPGAAAGGGPGAPGAPRSAPGPRTAVRRMDLSQPVHHGSRFQPRSNLDAWAFRLQGQGPGSVTGGENAYAGLMGAYPSEIIWAGFHGAYSPIAVAQNLIMPMWSQEIYLKITGNWDRIFQHFSAAASGRYLWFGGDIKAEFNNLRINGGIKVEVMVDGTTPQGAEQEKSIDKRIDLVTQQFTQQAMKVIFEPATPQVPPAEAPSGGLFSSIFGGSAGFALKYRRDEQHLDLFYEETRHFRYNQPNTISSSFEGFFNAIKQDAQAEKKYFTRLVMGDLSRKVTRIVKPVVNWPDPAKSWVGEPVAFLSAQVGYANPDGSLMWKSAVFQSTDTGPTTTFEPAFVQLKESEVSDPPEGWEPDKTFIKRKVHLREAPGLTDDPNVRVIVERNEVELDPGEHGKATSDAVIEVRADSAGKLEVGPVAIDMMLEDAKQIVEVEFRALGQTLDGTERPVVKFQWKHSDQDLPRYYEIFTGDLNYAPLYQYRVTCTVKGTFTTRGMSWTGPWVEGAGNGPTMIRVPMPDDPGVVQTKMSPRAIARAEVSTAAGPGLAMGPGPDGARPPTDGVGAPPTTRVGAGEGAGAAPTGAGTRPPGRSAAKSGRSSRAATRAPEYEPTGGNGNGEVEDDTVGGWEVVPATAGSTGGS
jgi:hypothetical protein